MGLRKPKAIRPTSLMTRLVPSLVWEPGHVAVVWSRQEILVAARTWLLRADAVTDGYSGVDVIAEPNNLLVIFRWRRDPNVYAIEVGFPATPKSPWTGLPVTSARSEERRV